MSGTALVFPQQRDGSFGDLLVQCPLLHALKASLGADRVVVIAPHKFANMLQTLGFADAVHIIADDNRQEIIDCVRQEDPRWAINLRGTSLRSTLLIRQARRRGHTTTAGWRSFGNRLLLNVTVPRVRDDYYAVVFGRIIEALGGSIDISACANAMSVADPDDALPDGHQRLVCLPSGMGAVKQWGIDNYIELGRQLCAKHQHLVPTAVLGPDEEQFATQFANAGWQLLVGRHRERLVAMCQAAYCVVGNDCGPGHLAQMSGAPIVTLYANRADRQPHANFVKLWWWRRPHSRAVTTAEPRAISDLPVSYIAEHVEAAVAENHVATEPWAWQG